jgi:SulP family sulfate permease
VYSNSRFFHQAKGGRPEAALVALFTLAFFFVSFRVLPYVPTIQASALVLFVGIELTLEALWESTASLTCCEWTVVAGTTSACTLLGFAPGVGVGLAIVVVLQFCHHVLDTVACHASSGERTLI